MDIYYSFDGFSTETLLQSNVSIPNYTVNSANFANINLSVNDGLSLSIRFYFYELSSYYSYLKNISLNGYSTVATPSNTAPSIDSPIAANVEENLSTVMTVLATDPEGDNISYSITGGVDQALFTIDATTGVLTFSSAPNFENPIDNGSDNVYNVQVTATDDGAGNLTDSKDIAVTVTNSSSESISTSGGGVNWSDGSTWTDGIPSDGDNVTISHDMIVDAGTNNLGSLTIDASKTLTVNTGQTLTTSGATDVNGTLIISGTGIVDANGSFDATGGNVNFTDAGTLKLAGTVTSLGTFSKAANCNVEYDGGNQVVFQLSGSPVSKSYYNLIINGTGTKTLDGSSKIYGDLALSASDFDLNGNTIYPKNNITRTSGNLIASASSNITIDNAGTHNICAFSDNNITIKTTSTGGSITTTGNIDCKSIDLTSGSKTFLVDGETINLNEDLVVTAGTFQMTSGVVNINSNSANSALVEGGTLDLDGGTLTVGNSTLADLTMTSGSIEVSGGTLNIVDELDVSDGTITQTGGTINIKSYVGSSSGTGSASKFEMDAGTLNLTSGTLRINGQTTTSASSNPAMSIGVGVTVNANAGHTTLIQSNNSSSNDEDIYVNTNGKDLGNLTVNLSGHEVYLNSNVNVLGAMTITAGELALGTHTTTVTGASDIDGTLTVSTGTYDANGTFDATGGNVTCSGSGRLQLGGAVTSLGTFTPGTSVVEYDGGAQTIDDFSAKSGPYYDLEIDGSGDKTLSGNTTVSNQLTFSADHDLVTSGSTLTITRTPIGYSDNRLIKNGNDANAVTVAYSSSSTSKCEIPVGIDGSHRMISLSAGGTSATTYTVVYTPGSPGTINWNTTPTGVSINPAAAAAHVNNHYYYDISRSGSEDVDCEMQFVGLTEPSDADKYIMHWNTGTSRWDQLTSSGSGGVVAATLTSFSPFTQGSGGGALPIDLVSFEGKCKNNETELEFVVASQVNNDYFSIHRSENATDWNLVGEIKGVGNTSTQMTYKWIDNNPVSGINYYRLSQTDYDGTSEMFSPIAVMCENTPVDGYSVYPNPANSVLNIDLDLDHYQGDDVSIEVIDINGIIILLQQVQLNRGYNHLEIDLSETPSGVYMINFVGTRDYIKESRIIKQ